MSLRAAFLLCLLTLLGPVSPVVAQEEYSIGFRPNSGDVWVDARLGDFNVYASGNLDGFVDEVVVSYGAPRVLVREYVVERRWPPGDVYYACALAHYSHHRCEYVLDLWERDHGRGWGVIAKRLGIKPGSPAFHALKGNIGKSDTKWRGRHGEHRRPEHPGERGKGHGKGRDRD